MTKDVFSADKQTGRQADGQTSRRADKQIRSSTRQLVNPSACLLTLSESKALRGIAILGIMLHNYCHFLGFAVKENEFTFTAAKPERMFDLLLAFDHNLFVHLMSFFGHYGVPVFLFVSGFGLVMKYEKSTENRVGVLPFVGFHYAKLLRLMFLGYIGFAVVSYLHPHGYHGYTVERVVAQLLMYINILPDPDHIIKPGPYWFFGLMLQLYIVYRLFVYRRHVAWLLSLMVVCWLVQAVFTPANDPGGEILNRLRYNFIGSMLPFGMGVLYARYGSGQRQWFYWLLLVLSVMNVFLYSRSFQLWLVAPAFVVAGAVSLVKLIPAKALTPFVWLGAISSALFVAHPITREIIIKMSYSGYVYTGIITYVVASILLAWLFKLLFRYVPKPKLNL